MKTGMVITGVVLILIALYLLFGVANPLVRWVGGIVVGVIGIWVTWKGAKDGGGMGSKPGAPAAPAPPSQPQ